MNSIGLALFLMLLFGGVLWYQFRLIQKANATLNWPATTGRILRAEIRSRVDSQGDVVNGYPDILYSYTVDGVHYSGKRISYGGDTESAESIIERYSPASTVQIYYNPSDPREAVLVPGSGPIYYTMIVGTVLLMVILIALWIRG